MPFLIKRIYDPPGAKEGPRVLVDRLWPQGMSKVKAKLDAWKRDLAPSNELRQWFAHDPKKWPEFQKRYRAELQAAACAESLQDLIRTGRTRTVTLLYAARDELHNNAVVLKEVLDAARAPD